jgi:hypothetical protein
MPEDTLKGTRRQGTGYKKDSRGQGPGDKKDSRRQKTRDKKVSSVKIIQQDFSQRRISSARTQAYSGLANFVSLRETVFN